MYKVEKTADTLFRGVDNMMNGAKEDYIKWSTMGGKELSGYSKEQVDDWDNKVKVKAGQKYIKIVRDNSVFAFVNINNPRFKKGDKLFFYSGLQILPINIFDNFDKIKFSFNELWDYSIDNKKLFGSLMCSNWYHVGDIQGLTIVKKLYS